MKCLIYKLDRWVSGKLLTYVSRLENRLWRKLYARPRKYCKCRSNQKDEGLFEQFIKGTLPCKDMFKNDQ